MHLTKTMLVYGLAMFYLHTSAAIVKWDGGGLDGKWNTASNWSGNQLPSPADFVVFDNSFFAGNYTVVLPGGTTPVTVASLTISPMAGNTIEVILPATNTAIPGFKTSGQQYGLVVNTGGIFRNASGAASGVPLDIADSICINNGGRYIHNTPRAHTSNVIVLSKKTGTETGIFEFDFAGGGPLLSLADRTYGTLMLSASAAGGTRTYNMTGSKDLTIRGDLIINNGVNFNLNYAGRMIIKGNFTQFGGQFNLATNPLNPVITIGKNLIQYAGSITENDEGIPVIEFNGTSLQTISSAGSIVNDVTVRINNPAGVQLQSTVSLPYKLELVQGALITSITCLLTLQEGCSITADSLNSNSFIHGPLRKEGLLQTDQFVFPVGKGNTHRWLALKEATGSYTVEFFRGNPTAMSNSYTGNIHHISSIEYWTVEADNAPSTAAKVILSFDDPNSGGVTDLSALRVSRLSGTGWNNAGNTFTAGTAGSNGHVTSEALYSFDSDNRYFTLASTSASFNPLFLYKSAAAYRNGGLMESISLAPSVAYGNTQLIVQASHRTTLKLMITNAAGKVTMLAELQVYTGKNTIPLHTSGLPGGIYTISIRNDKGQLKSIRMVKL